jgi:formylglycine-generating enzyme required for sulfatase activity
MTAHTHKRLLAIGITITLLAGTSWGGERTWTDATGKFSVTAELVEVRGDKVVLQRQNGKQITVPLAKLSAKDRQFLEKEEAGDPVSDEKTADPPLAVVPFDSDQAKAHQKAWADKLGVPVQITNSIGMKLNLIPPGEFVMGSPESEPKRYDDETLHLVKIAKPFYLSSHEVTQQQYEQVMGENPSAFSGLGDLKDRVSGIDTSQFPVEQVNWYDAVEFCRKLSNEEGVEYRLPTEAEWEYACRAGTTTAYSFGNDVAQLGEYAWYDANSKNTTHPVGELKPNAWGLYDMHGNVCEWCQDWYGPYGSLKVERDLAGLALGEERVRVLRGESFNDKPKYVRAAYRDNGLPGDRILFIGFRLARTCPLSP